MKKIIPFVTLFLGVVFTLSVYFYTQAKPNNLAPKFQNIRMFSQPIELEVFELISERQHVITNEELLGKWTVINFGYTSCPDICPTNLADISIMMRLFQKEQKYSDLLQSWFISVDPARDTSNVIASYTDAFDAHLLGMTGDHAMLNNFASSLGFAYQIQPVEGDSDVYWVSHTDIMIIIDPQGMYAGYMLPPYVPETMADALTLAISGESLN